MDEEYKKGIIYAIRSKQTDKIYIGSTCKTIHKRFRQHKESYNYYKNYNINYCSSYEILKFNDAFIEALEDVEFTNKNILLNIETEYIIKNKNIAVNIRQSLTEKEKKEYRENNKDKIKEYQKKYKEKQKNKNKILKPEQEKIKNETLTPEQKKEKNKEYQRQYKEKQKKLINYLNEKYIA